MKDLSDLTLKQKESKKKIFNLKKEIIKLKLTPNVSLNEAQQQKYDKFNGIVKKGKTLLNPYKNEKEFLMIEKRIALSFAKDDYKRLVCEEKGHKESVISTGNHGTYVNCKRCGESYTRPMSSEESKSFYEFMNTSFNI